MRAPFPIGKLDFCCSIFFRFFFSLPSFHHRLVGILHEHCTSYCTYVLFLSALPVSLPRFSLPAVFCFQSHISVVSLVCVCVCMYVCVCECVCVCVCGVEIALFLFWPSPLIRSAQQYLSLPPSLLSPYLPPSFTRQYSLLFSFLLFVAYCYRRECRYFLLHQRSFRVPTYSD